MLPYLVTAIILIGLPTLYVAVRYREYRKFLAGAFFVSSGMQFYFYLAKIPIPLTWTSAVQSPELSAGGARSTSCSFLSVCISGGSSVPGAARTSAHPKFVIRRSTLLHELRMREGTRKKRGDFSIAEISF